jgi:broad specificity phosphatase PhoE
MCSTSEGANAARALLVRHAQASWGSVDYDCLSPLGEIQARHLGRWLAGHPALAFSHVVRGAMRRHAQTVDALLAEFAAARRTLPDVQVDPGWNEFEHEPVLRAYAAAFPRDPDLAAARAGEDRARRAVLLAAVGAWREGLLDGAVPETWHVFGQRIAAARARIGEREGTVLVITSGGAVWRCAQAALDLDDAALVQANLPLLHNTSISEFHREPERWRMLSWGEVPHLDAPEHESLHSHY